MFGLRKKKNTLVYTHWYALFPDFRSSSSEFYDSVIEDLEAREVPGLDTRRINFFEGGILTQRRSYLRMERERIVFDVCSAPFGTAWFFSCRIAEIPFTLRLWELIFIAAGLFGLFLLYPLVFGLFWGPIVYGVSILSALVLLNTFAATATKNLDTLLLKVPVLGTLYELFVRRNQTYYREDTRAMYCDVVNAVVVAKLEELAAANGFDNVEFHAVGDPVSPRPYREKLMELLRENMSPKADSV